MGELMEWRIACPGCGEHMSIDDFETYITPDGRVWVCPRCRAQFRLDVRVDLIKKPEAGGRESG